MKSQQLVRYVVGLAALVASVGNDCFGIAISPGSNTTAGLGGTADAIVRVSAGGFVGSGTILKIQNLPGGGQDLLVLTADHVVRDASGGGSTLFAPNQISIGFGNEGGGGASFAAEAVATLFDLPLDGSSAVDLAMLDIFIPGSQLNTLPAGLTAASLPGAARRRTQRSPRPDTVCRARWSTSARCRPPSWRTHIRLRSATVRTTACWSRGPIR